MMEQGQLRPSEFIRQYQLINLKKVGVNLLADVIVNHKKLKNGCKIRLTCESSDWREIIINIPKDGYDNKALRLANMGYRDKNSIGNFYLFLHSDTKKPKKFKIDDKESLFIFKNDRNEESKQLYSKLLKKRKLRQEDLVLLALNEKKIDLDYYYDTIFSSEEITGYDDIFVLGLSMSKLKIKLKLTTNNKDKNFTLKFRGLGEDIGEKKAMFI